MRYGVLIVATLSFQLFCLHPFRIIYILLDFFVSLHTASYIQTVIEIQTCMRVSSDPLLLTMTNRNGVKRGQEKRKRVLVVGAGAAGKIKTLHFQGDLIANNKKVCPALTTSQIILTNLRSRW